MKSLVMVQPYIPGYRVPLFELLARNLMSDGIRLTVLIDPPIGNQAKRGDSVRGLPWAQELDRRHVSLFGRSVPTRLAVRAVPPADAYIALLQGTSADTFGAILRRRRHGTRVGLWGHVADYVSGGNRLDHLVERWQMRNADHIFAYVPSGARAARDAGVPPEQITTMMNSTDSGALRHARAAVAERDKRELRSRLNLGDRPCLLYVGGLDETKKVELLARSLDILEERAPDIHLLVAGAGNQQSLLNRSRTRGQATILGVVSGEGLAGYGAIASAIAMPGRVGLVAVDALALGLPIVTTNYAFHAPEFEYLDGTDEVRVSEGEATAYAEALIAAVRELPEGGRENHRQSIPTIEAMERNVRNGIHALMFGGARR